MAAKVRKAEIARKVKAQALQASGYVRSQLSGLTSPDRLIECDHYMLKGKKAEMSHARDEVEKARKELKYAQGEKFKKVTKNGGVMEMTKQRE